MGLLWIPVGLLVGVWAPRHRFATLLSCVGFLTVLLALHLVSGTVAPALVVGPALALAPAAAVLLARRWPRPFMPALLLPALAGCVITLPGTAGMPRSMAFAIIALGLGLVALGTFRAAWGIHLLCSAVGARLLLLGLPGSPTPWVWPGAAALLFLVGWLTCRGVKGTAPEPARVHRALAAWGVAILLLVVGAPYAARPLPPPIDAAHAARLARLAQKLPSGGLVWPMPSEALFWDHNEGFPSFENLDALYLSGKPAGLVRLPGSSPLWGAFWTHGPIGRMRLIKDAGELAELRAAAQATSAAVRESLALYRPGMSERELAAAIAARARAHGCPGESFPPIVAGGAAAAQPHAFDLAGALQDGQLVVTDVGCYRQHYASDFTRTLPVGGRFSERTRKLYAAVYAAQQAALKACRPGVTLDGRGAGGKPSLDELSREALKAAGVEPRYPHSLGHTVGLFAHDVFANEPLQPGMVITLEPGLYLPGDLGIRIEDTYLVTETGCELLTTGFPADPDSVEALMGKAPRAPEARQEPLPR